MVRENLQEVEEKIADACRRAGRDREEVTLIAVSKTKPVAMIEEAVDSGIISFGENKVQEMLEKQKVIDRQLQWHLLGHLQRNKVRQIVGKVTRIHSVDSLRLAKQIQTEYEKKNLVADILIEVNMAREESKFV